MPSAWFGTWTGDVRRAKVAVNNNYRLEMKSLLEHLSLVGLNGEPAEQAKGKPKRGKDLIWIGRNINVFISKLVHTEFTTVGGTATPIFEFDLVVNAREIIGRGRVGRNMELAYGGALIVTFPDVYPSEYPTFKLPKYRNFRPGLGDAHDHHMYAGGKMCLYGDFGRSESAWDREHDTAAKAFTTAVCKWIAWHELWLPKYEVDADDINRYF